MKAQTDNVQQAMYTVLQSLMALLGRLGQSSTEEVSTILTSDQVQVKVIFLSSRWCEL